jgi:riboflavin kinase/FMN adenylyltransferase
MRHVYGLQDIQIQDAWLTIGSYDGVHLGHQQIIEQITAGAHHEGVPAVVLTFHPHPSIVLRGPRESFYLTLPEERAKLLGDMGVDLVITHPFDQEVANMEPEAFLRRLHKNISFKYLWVGYDFALGRDRQGDIPALKELGRQFDFRLHTIPAYHMDGQPVSSSRVRQALAEDDIATANRLLGRNFTISGKVIPGDGRGKTIGIPTANLEVSTNRAVPGPGVYACWAIWQGNRYKAFTNIGVRPTFEDGPVAPRVETHILDFEQDLYGESVGLEFVAFLRDEKKFNGADELVTQIRADIEMGREILKK